MNKIATLRTMLDGSLRRMESDGRDIDFALAELVKLGVALAIV